MTDDRTAPDLAYEILKKNNEPMSYKDLIDRIIEIKDLQSDQPARLVARIHTEINLDPRFTYVGNGMWGLRDWAPRPSGTRFVSVGTQPQRSRGPERWLHEEGSGDEADVRRAEDEEEDWGTDAD